MNDPALHELERLFEQHGLPRHLLYPWWYRLVRATGAAAPPPVLMTLPQHLLWAGVLVFSAAGAAGVLLYATATVDWMHIWRTAALATALATPLAWWRYRRLRRRLGIG